MRKTFDDYNVIRRDLKVDGLRDSRRTLSPSVTKPPARRPVLPEWDYRRLPMKVEAATYATVPKRPMPERNIVRRHQVRPEIIINKTANGLKSLKRWRGGRNTDVARDMLNIQKAKLTGDYLHTSANIVGDGQVLCG